MMKMKNIADWFEKKYLEWQLEHGRKSLDEFAKVLHISRGYLSQILNGDKEKIGYKSALIISDALNDDSLLEILNYSRPEIGSGKISLGSLPPEIQETLTSALDEIERTFRTRSIQPDSPEGLEISFSVLKKFGVSFKSNSKG